MKRRGAEVDGREMGEGRIETGGREMRALQRLPRRAMVAANGVGVGVVVAVTVLVAGESRRHQTEHAAGAKASLRRSVQFAFRRRSAKYVTASAVGGVATHVVSLRTRVTGVPVYRRSSFLRRGRTTRGVMRA